MFSLLCKRVFSKALLFQNISNYADYAIAGEISEPNAATFTVQTSPAMKSSLRKS